MNIEHAKLIAKQTMGKYTAEDVINLAMYGTTNPMDFAPEPIEEGNMCMCGDPIDTCPDAYAHTTSGC